MDDDSEMFQLNSADPWPDRFREGGVRSLRHFPCTFSYPFPSNWEEFPSGISHFDVRRSDKHSDYDSGRSQDRSRTPERQTNQILEDPHRRCVDTSSIHIDQFHLGNHSLVSAGRRYSDKAYVSALNGFLNAKPLRPQSIARW